MRAGKWLRNSVEWGGNFTNVWGLLPAAWQTFVTAGFSALTAYFGIQEVGWARAIFLSSGVLAFGMTTVFLSLRIAQIMGMFQRLSISQYGITSISLNKNHSEITFINLNAFLRNDSQRPMFYRLRRANAVLELQNQVGGTVDTNVIIIPAFGGMQMIQFSTIQHVPIRKGKDAPAGQTELEIEYGPSASELDFIFRQVVDIQVGIGMPWGTKQQQAQLITQVKVLEHKRNTK